MMRWILGVLVALWTAGGPAAAQQTDEIVWVQIEARPNLAEALSRAESFARTLDDVNGFALGGGWYAITLGPYRAEDADRVLDVYRAEGLIPRDSYIARNSAYGTRFFPQGQALLRRNAEQNLPDRETQPAAGQAETDPTGPDAEASGTQDAQPSDRLSALEAAARTDVESQSAARAAERLLTPGEKRGLQEALQWAGFYTSTIDGAFGRGTRNAMASWQRANDLAPTGILTTAQRALLLGRYNDVLEGLGLASYRDETIGMELRLPLGLVRFERYAPPFAEFAPTGTPEARVLLISQRGDRGTLASLFDVMQTLEVVPLEGPRTLERDSFTLVGRSSTVISETRVSLENGALKGFTLIWPASDETRRERLIGEMARSLRRLDGVLDPALGDGAAEGLDFVSGLAVRKPRVARSGFFVTPRGAVITTADAVQSCTRILLDDTYEAQISAVDAQSGLAILTPAQSLSPRQIARFSQTPPRLQSGIAVAGYSYEGILGAPSVTFGTLADLRGLQGERNLNRLQLASLPGDAGGPVFDDNGNVVGMLLPRGEDNRRLPDDVSFSLAGAAIARAMRDAGIPLSAAETYTALPPEDITMRGIEMTVLVSCWE